MPQSVREQVVSVEDNRVDRRDAESPSVVNKVDRLPEKAIAMAKASVGAALKRAIGDESIKAFGDKGLVSKLTTGEKVPDYLARIYQDETARTEFALAMLEGLEHVEIVTETVVRVRKRSA
jgi:hypothetical protein